MKPSPMPIIDAKITELVGNFIMKQFVISMSDDIWSVDCNLGIKL